MRMDEIENKIDMNQLIDIIIEDTIKDMNLMNYEDIYGTEMSLNDMRSLYKSTLYSSFSLEDMYSFFEEEYLDSIINKLLNPICE